MNSIKWCALITDDSQSVCFNRNGLKIFSAVPPERADYELLKVSIPRLSDYCIHLVATACLLPSNGCACKLLTASKLSLVLWLKLTTEAMLYQFKCLKS